MTEEKCNVLGVKRTIFVRTKDHDGIENVYPFGNPFPQLVYLVPCKNRGFESARGNSSAKDEFFGAYHVWYQRRA